MSDSSKLPHWQQVVKDKYEEIREHPDFAEDVSLLRQLDNDRLLDLNIKRMIRKYDTPRGFYSFLKHYVTMGVPDSTQADSPITLVSEPDHTAYPGDEPKLTYLAYTHYFQTRSPKVLLLITGEVQSDDLIDFIKSNYKLIEEKLSLIEPHRPGAHRTGDVNHERYEVIRLYKKMKRDPKYSRKLYDTIHRQTEPNVDLARIKGFIADYRRQQKWNIVLDEKDLK